MRRTASCDAEEDVAGGHRRKGCSCRAKRVSMADRYAETFSVRGDTWLCVKKWKELNVETFSQDQVMKNVCGRLYFPKTITLLAVSCILIQACHSSTKKGTLIPFPLNLGRSVSCL